VIGQTIVLVGAVLTLLSGVGVVRFPDVLSRMHALSKASTVGFVLVAVGVALELDTANDVTTALLAAGLQILTLPVAANLIARSTYMAEGISHQVDAVDELADRMRARAVTSTVDGVHRADGARRPDSADRADRADRADGADPA
jgi:multicomponent Na+:H+ antiporter subunit G